VSNCSQNPPRAPWDGLVRSKSVTALREKGGAFWYYNGEEWKIVASENGQGPPGPMGPPGSTAPAEAAQEAANQALAAIEEQEQRIAELEEYRPKVLIEIFLSSGTFQPARYGIFDQMADIYIVGAGAGGTVNGGAGGGGRTILARNVRLNRTSYNITIGAGGAGGVNAAAPLGSNGGTTTAFGHSVRGGLASPAERMLDGGPGGSGGGANGGDEVGGTGGFGGGAGGTGAGEHGRGGDGAGSIGTYPTNPYDGVMYGCGGGGPRANGGGAGGSGSGGDGPGRNGSFGGGGGGSRNGNAGNGGVGGGGGGAAQGTGRAGNGGAGLVYIYAYRPHEPCCCEDEEWEEFSATTAEVSKLSKGKLVTASGELTFADVADYEAEAQEKGTYVAVLANGKCIDVSAFCDIGTAEKFLMDGVWPGADGVVVLPEGYGIGDAFDGVAWSKQRLQEEGGAHGLA